MDVQLIHNYIFLCGLGGLMTSLVTAELLASAGRLTPLDTPGRPPPSWHVWGSTPCS